MSSSYDPSLFERSDNSFQLSQRYKHVCHKFYGAFKVAFQMVSTSAVLNYSPRPLVYLSITIYLFSIAILAAHLVNQLRLKKKVEDVEDFDLLVVANPRHGILKKFERKDLLWILFSCVLFQAISIEDLRVGFRIFQLVTFIPIMLYFILSKLYRIRDAQFKSPKSPRHHSQNLPAHGCPKQKSQRPPTKIEKS